MVSPTKTTNIHKKNTADPDPIRLLLALIFVMFIQFVICGQFSSRIFRVDLLLTAPIYLALSVPLITAIVVTCVIGFFMDVLSGGFIGFHLFYYVIVAVFVAVIEQKINLSGIIQQVIILLIAWLLEAAILQFLMFVGADSFCEFCIFSKLFIFKTLAVFVFGLILLLIIPIVSGYRIRKVSS